MLIPNIFYTFYLIISLIIHKSNLKKVEDIFANMILEKSLDEKDQLNDYIYVEPNTVKFYEECTFYEKLRELYEKRDPAVPQTFMLYGSLFKNEYNIIYSSIKKHLIGVIGFLIIGIYYINQS